MTIVFFAAPKRRTRKRIQSICGSGTLKEAANYAAPARQHATLFDRPERPQHNTPTKVGVFIDIGLLPPNRIR
jgi:hypothetical protein